MLTPQSSAHTIRRRRRNGRPRGPSLRKSSARTRSSRMPGAPLVQHCSLEHVAPVTQEPGEETSTKTRCVAGARNRRSEGSSTDAEPDPQNAKGGLWGGVWAVLAVQLGIGGA